VRRTFCTDILVLLFELEHARGIDVTQIPSSSCLVVVKVWTVHTRLDCVRRWRCLSQLVAQCHEVVALKDAIFLIGSDSEIVGDQFPSLDGGLVASGPRRPVLQERILPVGFERVNVEVMHGSRPLPLVRRGADHAHNRVPRLRHG
jgi:hypothetical protein